MLTLLVALILAIPNQDCGPVLTVDRIVDGEWVVLETPDARTWDLPVYALPDTIREGDKITLCTWEAS